MAYVRPVATVAFPFPRPEKAVSASNALLNLTEGTQMTRRLTALAMAAMALASALLVPAPARAGWGVILFFVYCKREQVQKFEPFTGETFTREAWVCDWP